MISRLLQTGVFEIMSEGIKVTVEEGRSIQGPPAPSHHSLHRTAHSRSRADCRRSHRTANAYLKKSTFDEYTFTPPLFSTPTPTQDDGYEDDGGPPRCRFGINLATLLECLNIFGNAGGGSGASSGEKGSGGRERDEDKAGEGGGTTSLVMSYGGEGEPLVLALVEGGMVTRCDLTTYEPDELMELPFDDTERVQKLIIKVSPPPALPRDPPTGWRRHRAGLN